MCVVQSAEGGSGLEVLATRRSGEGLIGDQGYRLHMGIEGALRTVVLS